MAEIGIIIVTYNSASEIGPCLDAAVGTGADIVVVDNASHDGTPSQVERRGIRVIANRENRGFAAAVNQGFSVLSSSYVLLLNPDAILESGLDSMRAACDLPRTGAAGGKLVDNNGKPQTGFMVRRFPTSWALCFEALLINRVWPANPVNRRYRALDMDPGRPCTVEQPAGAFLMVRRSVWEELGGFDESFCPLWFEDVDFCRRIADRGYLLQYVPSAVAKHTGGHSIPQLSVEKRRVYWYRSLLRYSAKHFRPMPFRMLSLAVAAGCVMRAILESLSQRNLQPFAVNGSVVRLAVRCLFSGGAA